MPLGVVDAVACGSGGSSVGGGSGAWQAVAIGGRADVGPTPMVWGMAVLVALLLAAHARVKVPDVVFILLAGALTVVVLGFVAG